MKLKTPIYNAIIEYNKNKPKRFHTAGHSGNIRGDFFNFSKFDITELSFSDSLYNPKGIIKDAEEKTAKVYNSLSSLFFTNGGTGSIFASVYALKILNKNGIILAEKNVHISFINACKIFNVEIKFFNFYDNNFDNLLNEIKPFAVFITNPNYLGILKNINNLYIACKKKNVFLIVDACHGSHFVFSSLFSFKNENIIYEKLCNNIYINNNYYSNKNIYDDNSNISIKINDKNKINNSNINTENINNICSKNNIKSKENYLNLTSKILCENNSENSCINNNILSINSSENLCKNIEFNYEKNIIKGDLIINSLHKSMPCQAGASILNVYNEHLLIPCIEARRLTHTTSPCYITLASMDYAVSFLYENGENIYLNLYKKIQAFKKNLIKAGYIFLNNFDFTKIVIEFKKNVAEKVYALLQEFNIYPEGIIDNCIVFIVTNFNVKYLNDLKKALIFIKEKINIKKNNYYNYNKFNSTIINKIKKQKKKKFNSKVTINNKNANSKIENKINNINSKIENNSYCIEQNNKSTESFIEVKNKTYLNNENVEYVNYKNAKGKIIACELCIYPPSTPFLFKGDKILQAHIYFISKNLSRIYGLVDESILVFK